MVATGTAEAEHIRHLIEVDRGRRQGADGQYPSGRRDPCRSTPPDQGPADAPWFVNR